MPKFEFDRKFQIKIIGLLFQDYDFLIAFHDLIIPDHFSDDILVWFFCTIRDHYLDYQMLMSSEALENEMIKSVKAKKIKDKDIKTYGQIFKRLHERIPDKKYIADEIVRFCKHQAIKNAVLESPDMLKRGEFEEIESAFREAVQIGTDKMDMGHMYFHGWAERIRYRAEEDRLTTMPTGITPLDIAIGGGLRCTQLGIWMAPINRGKSVALCHCGKRALIARKKVAHYTYEMSEFEIGTRYDASFTKINMNDLVDKEYMVSSQMEQLGVSIGNGLLIKRYPTKQASVATIRAHLLQCFSSGFEPDLVLVDYLDLIKPPRFYKEKRDELTATTEELKGLALELNLPIWSATQSNRASVSLETHTEEHVAEDWGKMAAPDIVITINQVKEEVDDEIMRLFIAKNRNGARYRTVKIKTSLARMCFYVSQVSTN